MTTGSLNLGAKRGSEVHGVNAPRVEVVTFNCSFDQFLLVIGSHVRVKFRRPLGACQSAQENDLRVLRRRFLHTPIWHLARDAFSKRAKVRSASSISPYPNAI